MEVLAQRIVRRDGPEGLKNKCIVALDIGTLVAAVPSIAENLKND